MTKLLEVKNLKKYFPIYKGIFRRHVADFKAVDGVSFNLDVGEIVGLVGESGSGKTTVGRLACRLLEPTEGDVFFEKENLLKVPKKELRAIRKNLQMIFQDPLSSLNPRKTVLDNIGEAMLFHKLVKDKEEQYEEVKIIVKKVGLDPSHLFQFPHQFSGGQRQRISIGRSLALKPRLIICDEAVSALDLSIQAQIVNLLLELQQSENLSYLFISHDLSVVSHLCDRILVMYKGKIVESSPTKELFKNPKHPYTQMLLSSIPKTHPGEKKAPLPLKIDRKTKGTGCPFFDRCPIAKPLCEFTVPPTKTNGKHSYDCIY